MLCTLLSGLSLTAFADDTYYIVTYSVPTGYLGPDPDRVLAGHSYTLPTGIAAPEGYTFVGWYENPLQNEISLTDPDDHIRKGLYQPSGSITLYACYMRTENIAGYYEKTTGEPASSGNKYLIVYESADKNIAFTNKPGTAGTAASHYNTAGDFINVTIANDQIAMTSDVEAIALTIRRVSTGHFSVKLPNGKYLGYNSGTDLKLYDTEYTNNGIDFDALGYFVWNDLTSTDRVFSYSSRYDAIKFYKDGSNLYLYERHAPRTVDWYTTNPLGESECLHEHTTLTGAVAATCTEVGHTGVLTCDDCGATLQRDSEIPALGHDFDSGVVTAPSAANNYVGYTTYTCQRPGCGYSYQDNFTGIDYTVTYSVQGTTTTVTVNSYTGTTLPTTATAADGYTFAGWSEQAIPTDSPSAAILTGEYKPTANVTLYAVYSKDVADTGDGTYVKVAAGDPIATNGKYLFVSEPENGAIAFNAGAENVGGTQNYFAATISGNTVTGSNSENLDAAAVTAIRIAGTSYYGLQIPSGKYMGTTGSTGIATRNDAYPLSFSYDQDGYIEVQNTEGTTLLFRFNHAARSDKFGFYGLTTSTCDPVSLYYKDGSGSYTYYTTDPTGSTPPPSACDHNFVDNQCTICGERFRIRSASLNLNNRIDVVYICEIPSGLSNISLTVNGTAITEYQESNGYCYFFYTGVNPQCMGDNLSATLNGTYNGTTLTATKATYSVRQYCVNRLKDSNTSTELRALVTALLTYGTRAQMYMGYHTDAYVVAGDDIVNPINTAFSELSGYSASFEGAADADTYWISVGLTLTNGFAMNYRFYADSTSGLTVTVEFNGKTKTFGSNDFTAIDTNVYEITFDGINADEFADTVTAYFEQDDEQVGNTLLYSVNAYIQSKQNASQNKLKNLVRALSVYGVCVEAYKASLAN